MPLGASVVHGLKRDRDEMFTAYVGILICAIEGTSSRRGVGP